MSDIQYFTEEGLQKLKDELDHLKSVERPKGSNRYFNEIREICLKIYDARAQGHLEDRINKLELCIVTRRVIDTSKLDISTVRLLTKVTIKNTSNNMEMSYS